jgi:hypothetical protein
MPVVTTAEKPGTQAGIPLAAVRDRTDSDTPHVSGSGGNDERGSSTIGVAPVARDDP